MNCKGNNNILDREKHMEEKAIHQAVAGMFAPIAGSFVIDSLQMMIPWLIAMFCVIICDLVTGGINEITEISFFNNFRCHS